MVVLRYTFKKKREKTGFSKMATYGWKDDCIKHFTYKTQIVTSVHSAAA
jgi:hypothetical protein